ncbi:MAG: hypothetical protein ABJC24_08230 [Chloroflexota bacterium]
MSDFERRAKGESQGGMTGATGNLTPDEPDDEFVPAETRDINDPSAARQLTASAQRRAEARRAEGGDNPEGTLPSQADHGPISPQSILGGDERHDPEDEHL